MNIKEINNTGLANMIRRGDLDDEINEITRVFRHRYQGGQVDFGYIDHDGLYHAWFGGDYPESYDTVEDADAALEIMDEWMPAAIARNYRLNRIDDKGNIVTGYEETLESVPAEKDLLVSDYAHHHEIEIATMTDFFRNARVTNTWPGNTPRARKLARQHPGLVKVRRYRDDSGEVRKTIELEIKKMDCVIVESGTNGRIMDVRTSQHCQCDSGWDNIRCRHVGDDGCESFDQLLEHWRLLEDQDRL